MDKYKTNSFYLASFLYAKGIRLIDLEKAADSKKVEFVFEDSLKREMFLGSFNFGADSDPGVMVDARRFITAIKTLKEKLYQDSY